MEFTAFLGPSGQARDPQWVNEVSRNLFPIRLSQPSKGRPGQWGLQGTPGHETHLTLDTPGPVDLFEHDGRAYAASRTKAYEIFEDGSFTELGDIDGSNELTHFATNGDLSDEILIVGNNRAFILDIGTGVVTEVTDPELPSDPVGAEYVDGYFILNQRDSLQFNLSDLLDGTSWSGLDAAEKSSTSDRLVRVKENNGILWLFGRKRTELWHNDGNPSFPWTQVDNVIINQGLAALDAVTLVGVEDKTLVWLGQDGDGGPIAYRAQGYRPQRISTEREEHVWQGYAELGGIAGAQAWGYQLDGQAYFVLTFPAMQRTWVCNLTTGLWHEWSYFNAITSEEEPCLGRSHIYIWGKHFVGSRNSAAVYTMSPKIYEDDGELIIRTRMAPYIATEDYDLIHGRLALDMRNGHVAANVDPGTAVLRYSNDAGQTWSNGLARSLGATGVYDHTIEWHALGMSHKGRGYWLTIASRSFVSITGAYLDVQKAA